MGLELSAHKHPVCDYNVLGRLDQRTALGPRTKCAQASCTEADPGGGGGGGGGGGLGVATQRKNLIDLGHDLGNLDQDLMHPDQDSRFLAMMSKILPKKILNNFKIGLK